VLEGRREFGTRSAVSATVPNLPTLLEFNGIFLSMIIIIVIQVVRRPLYNTETLLTTVDNG
jgi:hypothetical protein